VFGDIGGEDVLGDEFLDFLGVFGVIDDGDVLGADNVEECADMHLLKDGVVVGQFGEFAVHLYFVDVVGAVVANIVGKSRDERESQLLACVELLEFTVCLEQQIKHLRRPCVTCISENPWEKLW
jgi:hypothetical protein